MTKFKTKYRVKIRIPKYETYELEALDAADAADRYSEDGKLVNDWEGDPQVVSTTEVDDA